MCSRYSMTSPPEAVRAFFAYETEADFPPRYNIAPTQPVPIVHLDPNGRRALSLVRWGLIPSWVKDPRDYSTLINARSETAAEKPAFRAAMRRRRCLFPADGFYEWSGPKGAKHAYLIRPRSGGPMAFAGLYEHWLGDGSEITSATILTTEANAAVAEVHERMPAILQRDDFAPWLDCEGTSVKEARGLLAPACDDCLEVIEISTRINNPRLDEPSVQEPLGGEKQRPLL